MSSEPAAKGPSLLLDRLDAETTARVAEACMYLLGDMTWIRRRSEQVTFYEYETLRVSTTLDVAIPSALFDLLELDRPRSIAPATDERRKRRIVVPLDILPKGPLVHFDLTVDGKSTTLLSAREAARITASMLGRIAIDAGEPAAGDEVIDLLERLAAPGVDRSTMAYADLRGVRRTSKTLLRHAQGFCESTVLFAEITTEERNLIIKYARDESLALKPAWRQRFGSELTQFDVPLPSMGRCGSYHAEAILPGELKICGARLTDARRTRLTEEEDSSLHVKHTRDRASLYVRSPPSDGGRMIVTAASHRSVLLRPALVIALLTALTLLVGGVLALAGQLGTSLNGAAATPLYLALSLGAGLVLYRPEAPLVRVMLARLRATLAIVAGMTVVGGALLAFGLRNDALGYAWLVLACLAGVGAEILARAYCRAIPEVPRAEERAAEGDAAIVDHGFVANTEQRPIELYTPKRPHAAR